MMQSIGGVHYYIDGLVQYCSISSALISNGDYKNPLHRDVVDGYLRLMGDKTIPDEAPPCPESFHHPES